MRDEWNNSKKIKIKYLSCELSKILKHIHIQHMLRIHLNSMPVHLISSLANSKFIWICFFSCIFFIFYFQYINKAWENLQYETSWGLLNIFLNFHSYLSATPVIICAQAFTLMVFSCVKFLQCFSVCWCWRLLISCVFMVDSIYFMKEVRTDFSFECWLYNVSQCVHWLISKRQRTYFA